MLILPVVALVPILVLALVARIVLLSRSRRVHETIAIVVHVAAGFVAVTNLILIIFVSVALIQILIRRVDHVVFVRGAAIVVVSSLIQVLMRIRSAASLTKALLLSHILLLRLSTAAVVLINLRLHSLIILHVLVGLISTLTLRPAIVRPSLLPIRVVRVLQVITSGARRHLVRPLALAGAAARSWHALWLLRPLITARRCLHILRLIRTARPSTALRRPILRRVLPII